MHTFNLDESSNNQPIPYLPSVDGPQLRIQQLQEEAMEAYSNERASETAKMSCYQQISAREGMEMFRMNDELTFRLTITEETLVSLLEARLRFAKEPDISLDGVIFAVTQNWLEMQQGISV